MTTRVTGRRFALASPATVIGALVLALAVAEVVLSFLAHDFAVSASGAGPAALLVYAAVGAVVARHQPRNPMSTPSKKIGSGSHLVMITTAALEPACGNRTRIGCAPED